MIFFCANLLNIKEDFELASGSTFFLLMANNASILSISGGFPGTNIVGFPDATGKGGSINITTDNLTVDNQAQVAVSSVNSTDAARGAGNININAENISLLNRGKLNAQSNSGDGGNINLNVKDLLILRDLP